MKKLLYVGLLALPVTALLFFYMAINSEQQAKTPGFFTTYTAIFNASHPSTVQLQVDGNANITPGVLFQQNYSNWIASKDASNQDTSETKNNFTNKKVILFTSYRSGSSFVGHIIATHPDVFYMFEPLMFFELHNYSTAARAYLEERQNQIMSDLLDCELQNIIIQSAKLYSGAENKKVRKQWLARAFPQYPHLHQLAGMERIRTLERYCKTKSVVAIKTIRARNMAGLMPLVDKENVFIYNLVRDPRGSIQSIVTLEHRLRGAPTANVTLLERTAQYRCNEHRKDLHFIKQDRQYRDMYRLIRYEDFAFHPLIMAEKLLRCIGLELSPSQREDIYNSTHVQGQNSNGTSYLYSTARNSNQTAEHWISSFPFEFVSVIQDQCVDALVGLGYSIIGSSLEQNSTKSCLKQLPADLPGL